MAIDPPSKTRLRRLDGEIRCWIKEVLKLPPSTPKGLLHAQCRKGGLGLPTVANMVWLSHLGAASAVLSSPDPLMRFYCNINNIYERVQRHLTNWGLGLVDDGPNFGRAKASIAKKILDDWAVLGATGHGVQSFRDDPVGNKWLGIHGLLSESHFLIALRLRANLVGTRQALRRADPGIPPECRKCGAGVESLMHVLNVCPENHRKIVKRHDDIKEIIASRLEQTGWAVMVEAPFEDPRAVGVGRLRPDIVAFREGSLRVVDIAVAYEDGSSLDRVADGKINKYSALAEYLLPRFECEEARVVPVVIGSRGALSARTRRGLSELGLSATREGLTCSMLALRSAVGIASRHMDG